MSHFSARNRILKSVVQVIQFSICHFISVLGISEQKQSGIPITQGMNLGIQWSNSRYHYTTKYHRVMLCKRKAVGSKNQINSSKLKRVVHIPFIDITKHPILIKNNKVTSYKFIFLIVSRIDFV